ncbi:ankyrin repeat domain-containing protein [Ruegeria sp. ANG10]|uniref:ankyrin repeat domain-containing protein n=1 Tax=Ruegeria sp. ANG10 TaxID=3042467 RepID=UPI0034573423
MGKPNQVELFVLRNADLNIEDEVFEWTPLQVAEVFGHQEAAEILKEKGAVYSSDNLKAFQDLVGSADNPSEKRLQAKNYASTRNNLLLFAAEINDPDMVEQLISLGANPLYSSNNGWTPLMYAAMQRGVASDVTATIEVLSKFVESPRSYFRLEDAEGNTPLLIALSMNVSRGVVEALVNKGGVPENPNKFGFSTKKCQSRFVAGK